MADQSTHSAPFPDPAAMDFIQNGERWFKAERKYLDCRFSWWGLKSHFGICDAKKLEQEVGAADAGIAEAEKRLSQPSALKP